LTARRLERFLLRACIGSAFALQCLYPGNACLPLGGFIRDALRDDEGDRPAWRGRSLLKRAGNERKRRNHGNSQPEWNSFHWDPFISATRPTVETAAPHT